MLRIRLLTILIAFSLQTIGSGCFMQPVKETKTVTYFVDLDAPAVRLAEPVKAKILVPNGKDKNGKTIWVNGGKTTLPAGGYFKGRPPEENVEDILKKEGPANGSQ